MIFTTVSSHVSTTILLCVIAVITVIACSGVAKGGGATAPPNGPKDRSREKSKSVEKF